MTIILFIYLYTNMHLPSRLIPVNIIRDERKELRFVRPNRSMQPIVRINIFRPRATSIEDLDSDSIHISFSSLVVFETRYLGRKKKTFRNRFFVAIITVQDSYRLSNPPYLLEIN